MLKPAKIIDYYYFYPFGTWSVNPGDELHLDPYDTVTKKYYNRLIFQDQEPFDEKNPYFYPSRLLVPNLHHHLAIIANSEKSKTVDNLMEEYGYYNWHYFFHGFAALNWYKDFEYFSTIDYQPDRVFICLNHLCTQDRSYRLTLVADLKQRGLLDRGYVSLHLKNDTNISVNDELFSENSKLSKKSKKLIFNNLKDQDNLVVDRNDIKGSDSANISPIEIKMLKQGLVHVVTETVFYYDKLHLTEKIFKPIVVKRPFILVGAPGNLAYLKSYGFKTFDRWIDESYDQEQDPDKRLSMIVDEIEKLCGLTDSEMQKLYNDMQDVLEYNFDHFYGKFKKIITDELVDNFKLCIDTWNSKKTDSSDIIEMDERFYYDAKRILSQ